MKIQIWFLVFISAVNLVTSGYLLDHHPLPPNLITSSTVIGSSAGGTPSSGAYSTSQLTQTVSTSPQQIRSSISTYHPLNYNGRINQNTYQSGHNQRDNQSRYLSQFTPNRLYNPSQANNYNTNHPSVLTYRSYDNQGPRNYNQDRRVYYQRLNNDYDTHNNYGEY